MVEASCNEIENLKKRIIIHVGPPKTGSSAIQAWLHSNSELLSQSGVFYPTHSISENGVSSGNRDSILSMKGDDINAWYVDVPKLQALLVEFKNSNHHTLLLSSEFFYLTLKDLATLLPNAEFIFYLRNPLELIESSYNQGIKRHGVTHSFNACDRFVKFNSRVKELDNLISKFGKERFIIKSYDLAKNSNNGGLVGDFTALLNISCNVESILVNPSYCLEALEFKRLINHFNLGNLAHKIDQLLQNYRNGTQKYSFVEPSKFSEMKEHYTDELAHFVKKHQLVELDAVSQQYKATIQRPYKKQFITQDEIKHILGYLEASDRLFYLALKETIRTQPYFKLDNNYIYNALEVEPKRLSPVNTVNDGLKNVFNHLPQQFKLPSITKLAHYHLASGDIQHAQNLFELALHLEPNNTVAYNNLATCYSYKTLNIDKQVLKANFFERLKRFCSRIMNLAT